MQDTEQRQADVGTVVEASEGKVKIEVVRGAGCKSCSMRGMCFGRNTPAVFELEDDIGLQPGDRVELEISPGSRVMSALMVFGLPMVFFFAGFIITRLWTSELFAIGAAFAATSVSFLLMRWLDNRLGGRLQVRLGRKL